MQIFAFNEQVKIWPISLSFYFQLYIAIRIENLKFKKHLILSSVSYLSGVERPCE
jgi:hypothetical protein